MTLVDYCVVSLEIIPFLYYTIYHLFVYVHILAMVTSISIILFWLYFHIFHFFIFFISCIFCSSAERINEMMTVASWKTS